MVGPALAGVLHDTDGLRVPETSAQRRCAVTPSGVKTGWAYVISRITAPGSVYLALVALIPTLMLKLGYETGIDEKEWLQAAATNPAFDFLKEPEEDIYTLADGKPFYDQG